MKVEDVITRSDFNSLRNISYEQFCDLISKIAKLCVEESLKQLPHVITGLVNHASYLKALSEEFYKNNPDLARDKVMVSKVIEQVEAKNPGMKIENILTLAAPKAREALTLKSKFKEQ